VNVIFVILKRIAAFLEDISVILNDVKMHFQGENKIITERASI
jgi:hypothetical protein